MGLLHQEDQSKGCRSGFQRQDFAVAGQPWPFHVGAPATQNGLVYFPLGPTDQSGPLNPFYSGTAQLPQNAWLAASQPNASQPPLWLGLAFTKFLPWARTALQTCLFPSHVQGGLSTQNGSSCH